MFTFPPLATHQGLHSYMWVLAAILGIAKVPADNMGPYTDYPGPPQRPSWLPSDTTFLTLLIDSLIFYNLPPLKVY